MTAPIYNPNVPEELSDSLSETQPDILVNFQTLFDTFLVNHVSLTAASGAGNHNMMELVEQLNSAQTNLSEISVYTKDVTGQTDQTFMRFEGNGTEFQFTNWQLYSLPDANNQINYFTFLPGKILVYFGSFTPSLPNNTLILYPGIAKNIITMSFCPIVGTVVASRKSIVTLQQPVNGYYTAINVYSGFAKKGSNSPADPSFYFVMANV